MAKHQIWSPLEDVEGDGNFTGLSLVHSLKDYGEDFNDSKERF